MSKNSAQNRIRHLKQEISWLKGRIASLPVDQMSSKEAQDRITYLVAALDEAETLPSRVC